jgi:hypothetical protein
MSMSARWVAALPGFWAALHAAPAAAAQGQSLYSDLQNCPQVSRLRLPDRVIESGRASSVSRCEGVGGYTVYVVDDDPRSFLALERGGRMFSLERPMSTGFRLGAMPNVAGSKKAEWRLDARGEAAGLIVRVSYQRTDGSRAPGSTLLVFDLRGVPAYVGAAKTNEEARDLVDQALDLDRNVAAPSPPPAATPKPAPAPRPAPEAPLDCDAAIAGLCKSFVPGPERLGRCYDAQPSILERAPARCVPDMRTNIENYHQAKGGKVD